MHSKYFFFISILLISYIGEVYADEKQASGANNNFDYLVKRFKEPQRSQLKYAIGLAIQKHPGKVIGISPESNVAQHPYKIKILKDNGHVGTYYINQSFKQIKP